MAVQGREAASNVGRLPARSLRRQLLLVAAFLWWSCLSGIRLDHQRHGPYRES